MSGRYVLHGLKHSYFTGKLETYMRAKGIPYDFVVMDIADFMACARATGVAQMPQLQCPDGTWLTDTTPIIAHFEDKLAEPRLHAEAPLTRFFSLFLEDFADEVLWRPAMYYRWAYAADAELMGRQLGDTMMRDRKAPRFIRALMIKTRQQRTFLKGDGITKETAPAVEALYHDTLAHLEAIFARRPFLFGECPVEADFGMMGPMFRHFSIDPTGAAIMREEAPLTLEWVGCMWATTPARLHGVLPAEEPPEDLRAFVQFAAGEHLPALAANATAFAAGEDPVHYQLKGAAWSVPLAPYRVQCLARLQALFGALCEEDKVLARDWLGEHADVLTLPVTEPPALAPGKPRSHLWRT